MFNLSENTMGKSLLLLLSLAASLPLAHAADLEVGIGSATGKEGTVYLALYDRNGFLRTPLATATASPANPVAVFHQLSPGAYAVAIFQDLNGNGKLDRNMAGLPLEPYGFSNNAMGVMGPPDFAAAAVQVAQDRQAIVINLHQ